MTSARGATTAKTWRTIDDAQVGISWDYGDTALTIMNPAYGLYRLFGGRSATSGDGGAPTGMVHDIKKTAAYKALLAAELAAERRAAAAEKQHQEALRALAAVRAAPLRAAAPIEVSVPSFSLGRRIW